LERIVRAPLVVPVQEAQQNPVISVGVKKFVDDAILWIS
jgi:hypothetical protein